MIEEFIEATRGPRVQVRVLPQQAALYQSMFRWVTRRLDSMIGSGQPADRLLVVYSHAGQAETVSLDGGRTVIYDQYLGQIMNRLNRLLFENAPVTEVDAYLCKLFALRFLAAGRQREALEYAYVHFAWSEPAEQRGLRLLGRAAQVHAGPGMFRARATNWPIASFRTSRSPPTRR